MYFVGIDPGRTGGIGCIGIDQSVRVWRMPPATDRGIPMEQVKDIFASLPRPCTIALEWNTSRPEEVPDYAFRFGLQTGQLDGLLGGMGIRPSHLTPQAWKAKLGLVGKSHDPDSVQGQLMWKKLYPQYAHLIYGPRGGVLDGPLDALLIAEYVRIINVSVVGKWGRRPPRFRGLTAEQLQDGLREN